MLTAMKKAKSRYDELEHQKENKLSKRKAIDRFISDLLKRDELLTEFDNCLWLTVADKVTVRKDGTLVLISMMVQRLMGEIVYTK